MEEKIMSEETETLEERLANAVVANDLRTVRDLVERGADYNAKDDHGKGCSPLAYAVTLNRLEMAHLLLDLGASPNSYDKDGSNLLQTALVFGRYKMAKLLMEHGANPDAKMDGSPLLHLFIAQGRKNAVHFLAGWGASINAKDSDGFSALELADFLGQEEVAGILRKYGAIEVNKFADAVRACGSDIWGDFKSMCRDCKEIVVDCIHDLKQIDRR
jgi:ankyrin repeat protein